MNQGMRVSKMEMMRNPSHFVMLRGVGYAYVGEIEPSKFGKDASDAANPPPRAIDRSWHMLLPPNGHDPMAFQWLARARTWYRGDPKGNRMGFTPAYLSSHGWKYVGAAENYHG